MFVCLFDGLDAFCLGFLAFALGAQLWHFGAQSVEGIGLPALRAHIPEGA